MAQSFCIAVAAREEFLKDDCDEILIFMWETTQFLIKKREKTRYAVWEQRILDEIYEMIFLLELEFVLQK